jgi:hypothetical protein
MGLPSGSSIWICLPAGASFHLVAESNARFFQGLDPDGQVGHAEKPPVPATGFLVTPVGHRA